MARRPFAPTRIEILDQNPLHAVEKPKHQCVLGEGEHFVARSLTNACPGLFLVIVSLLYPSIKTRAFGYVFLGARSFYVAEALGLFP
jgi:hypothetical protein